jgi:hypothetical protein
MEGKLSAIHRQRTDARKSHDVAESLRTLDDLELVLGTCASKNNLIVSKDLQKVSGVSLAASRAGLFS